MKPLILIKHSLPEILDGIPAREWKLSEEGRIRARKLAEQLKEYEPDVILSSLEPKAQETAEILAEYFGLKNQTFEALHEHDRSQSPFYGKEEFQALVQKFFAQPDELIFGSETAIQALGRFEQAVQSILNAHHDKTIFIVAHGTIISLFVSKMTACDGYAL
jgi:broad specificity phosphatase PhoE